MQQSFDTQITSCVVAILVVMAQSVVFYDPWIHSTHLEGYYSVSYRSSEYPFGICGPINPLSLSFAERST